MASATATRPKKPSTLSHMGARQYRIGDRIGQGRKPDRPFVAPPCARCRKQCVDARGEPRWDLLWPFTFVCLEACT